jgi:prophage maintenance system killer protein
MSESPFLYLSVDQIRELHDAVLEEHGGTRGSRMGAGLDSCVTAPQTVAYLQGGDVFQQASAYACSILQKSPFKDGNCRTALVTALVFLEINAHQGIVITMRQCCCKPCFISPKAKWTEPFFRSFCAKLFLELQGRGRMNRRIVEPQ